MEASLIGKALDFGSSDYGFESHVSKLNYSCINSHLLSHINFTYARQHHSFVIKISSKSIKFLNLLKKISYIQSFTLFQKSTHTYAKIFLLYFNSARFLSKLKLTSSPNKKYYFSLKALRLINKKTGNSLLLLSTSKGLITHKQALKYNSSGFILGYTSL